MVSDERTARIPGSRLEIIAASTIYTIKKYGPDRIIGFSPIPGLRSR